MLDKLEANDRARGPKGLIDGLPLFAATAKAEPKAQLDTALQTLDEIDSDTISPRQVLGTVLPAENAQASLTRLAWQLLADRLLDLVENTKRCTHFTAIALTMPFLMHRLALAQTLYEFVQALRRDG